MIKSLLLGIAAATALTGCVVVPVHHDYQDPIVPTVVVPVYRNPYYVYERSYPAYGGPVYVRPGVGWRHYYHR